MHACDMLPSLSRRTLLGSASAAAVVAGRVGIARAATNPDARLVVINMVGGLDALSTAIPYTDPYLYGLRAGLVPAAMIKVDPAFALHPSLPHFAAMYQAGEASVVHAVGPTAETRSHFVGQDYLQSGTGTLLQTGWLNRAISASALPARALSIGAEMPLLMRGPIQVGGYAPCPFAQISPALVPYLQRLMVEDPLVALAQQAAFADRAVFDQILNSSTNINKTDLPSLATLAGLLLASDAGPRVIAMQTSSVDTHNTQASRIGPMLAQVDGAIAALRNASGAAWANTVVMTMTEFGRTAYENGTQGTDHGTGFAVLLAGGAVAGGKIVLNGAFPGLRNDQLFQGRDLNFNVTFPQVAMGILIDHMGISPTDQSTIFPNSSALVPVRGLVTG